MTTKQFKDIFLRGLLSDSPGNYFRTDKRPLLDLFLCALSFQLIKVARWKSFVKKKKLWLQSSWVEIFLLKNAGKNEEQADEASA